MANTQAVVIIGALAGLSAGVFYGWAMAEEPA
jgi:hypothetical protein